jgi:GT2 family glycosyltransferase
MYVCIINNDIHFSSQTIYCLLKIYQELENPFIISPVQILPSSQKASFYSLIKIPSLLEEIRSYFYFWKLKGHKYFSNTSRPNIQRVEIIPGAFLFLDFKNFQKLGFFDEDTFLFGEEKLLAKKIKDNGFYNYIVLDLNYVHEHSKTINSEASLAKQRKMILEGKLIYADKYRRFPSLSKFLIQLSYFYGAKIMANFVRIVRNTKTDN